MPENKALPVLWTNMALLNAQSIKKYIQQNFSEKEVSNFLSLLLTFEKATSVFPKLYPISSQQRKIRRAVLSKELSVYYKISGSKIEVLAVIDNRSGTSEWQ